MTVTDSSRAHTLFDELKGQLAGLLGRSGFSSVEERVDEKAFGSRYVTFEAGDQAIRFVWDGKDYLFALEESPVQEGNPNRAFADIALQRFDPRKDGTDREDEVRHHVMAAAREFVAL